MMKIWIFSNGQFLKVSHFFDQDFMHQTKIFFLLSVALKHQKLSEFVPKEVASILYIEKKPKKNKKDKNRNASLEATPIKTLTKTVKSPSKIIKTPTKVNCKVTKINNSELNNKSSTSFESSSPEVTDPASGFTCQICQRVCKQFHYFRGHMSMHYRENIKERVGKSDY